MLRCQRACCRRDGEGDKVITSYYQMGYSSDQIAKLCGSSDTHICTRLKSLGVEMRSSKDYIKRKGGRKRKSRLWEISEKDLFETPMSTLMERYGVSRSEVGMVRRKRR